MSILRAEPLRWTAPSPNEYAAGFRARLADIPTSDAAHPNWQNGWGSLAGLALGAAASRLLAHIVYGASSLDPVVLGGVVAAMAVLALGASWLPAQRAMQVDPATLLREE